MTKHVHHDMIVEWAKDTSRVVEVQDHIGRWYQTETPGWRLDNQYRFKPAEPRFIVVNGVNVPEPVRGGLVDGQTYWVADPTCFGPFDAYWTDTSIDRHWLSLGLIHLTKEAAQAHIDAMLLPSRSDK